MSCNKGKEMSDCKIGICGHFGGTKEFLDGQTIKTKVITEELRKQFKTEQLITVDTYGGIKVLVKCLRALFSCLCCCENIIILPAHKSVRVFSPFLVGFNRLFKRKLHYIVIGGWLPVFLKNKPVLKMCLKKIDYIYVETKTMKTALEKQGFMNIVVMPNCKKIRILEIEDLESQKKQEYRFCTFSRVMREKGIEIAIEAIKMVNEMLETPCARLDIYGQIDKKYQTEFRKIENKFPDEICYKGKIPFDKSTEVLKDYYALVFPTFYEGEGFAGTLLDAMAAGVPVIASDWKYNCEIVISKQTGILLENCTSEKLAEAVIWTIENSAEWNKMRYRCIENAKKYTPENVLQPLIAQLKLSEVELSNEGAMKR